MESDQPLASMLPPIRRARGFRLYDVRGRRYLDLYREGALLGYREAGVLTAMKAVLSQGLSSALPSIWERRLSGALARLFPGCAEVRLYSSEDRALSAARSYLGGVEAGSFSVLDPAVDSQAGGGRRADGVVPAAFWRPFLPAPRARAVLPVLPVRVGASPSPVCFDAEVPSRVPPSDTIPGFILAGAARGLAALASLSPEGPCPLSNPALDRALDAAPGWSRLGPYLAARCSEPEYAEVRDEFLRAGVLLSPDWPGPSVLPGRCSPGETRLLAELFAGTPGG